MLQPTKMAADRTVCDWAEAGGSRPQSQGCERAKSEADSSGPGAAFLLDSLPLSGLLQISIRLLQTTSTFIAPEFRKPRQEICEVGQPVLHSERVLRKKKKSHSLGSFITPPGRVESVGLPSSVSFLPCENLGLVGKDCSVQPYNLNSPMNDKLSGSGMNGQRYRSLCIAALAFLGPARPAYNMAGGVCNTGWGRGR